MTPRHAILVVDDEPLLLRAVVRMIGAHHDVTACESGAAALALLDGGTRFDAILCDMRLQDMSGVSLYERIVRSRPELSARVLFMTGSSETPTSGVFLKRHAERVLLKPFRRDELLAALARILAPAPSAPAASEADRRA